MFIILFLLLTYFNKISTATLLEDHKDYIIFYKQTYKKIIDYNDDKNLFETISFFNCYENKKYKCALKNNYEMVKLVIQKNKYASDAINNKFVEILI